MGNKNIIADVISFVETEADFRLSESEAYNIIKFILKIQHFDIGKEGGAKSKRKLTKEEVSKIGRLAAENWRKEYEKIWR